MDTHIRWQKREGKWKEDRGTYTLEAAIFLPLFILAVAAVAFIIKLAGIQGSMYHAAADESAKAALDAYGLPTGAGLPYLVQRRIEGQCGDVSHTETTSFQYMHKAKGMDGLISLSLRAAVDLPLPVFYGQGMELMVRVRGRAWIGRDPRHEPTPFDAMEKEDTSVTVWIFPNSGTHYHAKGCTFVANTPEKRIFGDDVAKNYKACEKCDSKEVGRGSFVYCYPDYGEAYHRKGCTYVEKYVRPMEKQDAVDRGYAPCGKCGGQ